MDQIKNTFEMPFSGPAPERCGEVSPYIRNAPAYDLSEAQSYVEIMPEIRNLTSIIEDNGLLTTFGRVKPEQRLLDDLSFEIEKLTVGDHKVSLIMADLKTRSGVAFCPFRPMCSQSTIKGIYAGAVLEMFPGALKDNGLYIHDAIIHSDNASYEKLRMIYGAEPLIKWCQEADVDPSFAKDNYPRDKTAVDMFKMWTRLYCFLNGKAQNSDFAAWFADSIASAAGEQLRSRCPVQTKAGWENGLDESREYDSAAVIPPEFTDGDPLNDECAINDSGIVYTAKGPYLFVIYTDHPFGVFRNCITLNPLPGLTEALYAVQQSLPA
ncbi:MAG: hypothetical protein IJI14_01370 [Anaerolineaceae bacterium]|nr:hypothetical protein [Anaerolineaceae bacterium]